MAADDRANFAHGPSRRAVFRAGLAGAASLGLVSTPFRRAASKETTTPDICPAWPMGTSQGSMGQTIYTYYAYQFDDNCMPILSTGSTIDSASPLTCGCGSPDCRSSFTANPPADRKPARAAAPRHAVNNHHYYENGLESTGATDFTRSMVFPQCEIAHDKIYQCSTNNAYIRLVVAVFPVVVQVGGNPLAVGYGYAAIGREVDKPNGPVDPISAVDRPAKGEKYRVFSVKTGDARVNDANGTVECHTLFMTKP